MIKNNVAATRNLKNITQEELAHKAKISRVALSAIENGTVPNGDTMFSIAKALDKRVEEIFFEESVKHEQQRKR